ncbi:hypothetical protein LUZ61_005145 [Rhynchospora tenuis]|uniref:NB-ARC domain-containing protein n=1 Tax=Rhynchospora tenuis TaxID=198213 RepID=A0AAD6EUG8_9POAL|nr:hypothetical protein LUZ61_005145 [Rhynchospora tenuis]
MAGPEAAAGLAALGWVVSPVVKDLVSKGISYLGSDIAEGLEDLEATLLPQFQLTIQAAQNSTSKDKLAKLAKWIARLKNAYYDAEAILHDLEYEGLKRRAKGGGKKPGVHISSHPIIKPLANFTRKLSQKVSLLSAQKKRLLDQLNKLKKIATEAKEFRDLLGKEDRNEIGVLSTTSGNTAFLIHKVFGRDEVRDQIIKFLLGEDEVSSSTRSYSVVAITGIGGAGKTTLAQYVYNDEKIEKTFFRMWLCLSENKEVKVRTREMIECASEKKCPNLLNLTILQNKLIESLPKSKSILLVLDDVWYDTKTEKQWDDLLAPFAFIGGSCKIMVTSRNTLFPNALEPGKLIKLNELATDDFKSLFSKLYFTIGGWKVFYA